MTEQRLRRANLAFRPRARLLRLLGDQLIRDASIAVFELVKNAYDADATRAVVTLVDVDNPQTGVILVEDDGCGMDFDRVRDTWFEPGTDFRRRQREVEHERTPLHGRLPLGEKGVGRFAADKLGSQLHLVSRAEGHEEVVLTLDWDELADERYLDEAKVTIAERHPEIFPAHTGTRIEIHGLREPWDRRSVRALSRSITSICSPFGGSGDFEASLVVRPHEDWLHGLLTAAEINELALFHAFGKIDGREVSFNYTFSPLPSMDRVSPRSEHRTSTLQAGRDARNVSPLDLADFRIGEVSFELLIFDREPQILALGVTDKRGLKEYLDQNGGVRVYREGIRIYDYGEPGNDWLGLDAARVNIPTRRISNNIVIGAVSLDLRQSQDLVEKTNREGFVENAAYHALREAVRYTVQQVAYERNIDKERIRRAYTSRQRQPVLDSLDDLRASLRRRNLLDELAPQLNAVERDYVEMRDQLLTAAGAGLSLSVVVHEVDKAIADLNRALERDVSIDRLRQLSQHLAELVDGLTYLVRRSGARVESAATMVGNALFNVDYRLTFHKVQVTNRFSEQNDFKVRCVRRLVIASLMNIIDNSIWWLGVKSPITKRIWIGPSRELGGPAVVLADNGPGFVDPPDILTQPFMSRRTEGMGLGLHLASEVMRAQGGQLVFPQPGDIDLPRDFSGAVVALRFKGS
jgi:signal transduction histidine kinase/anti-sigma regulatory factor (Ser/Thr protein kinase)